MRHTRVSFIFTATACHSKSQLQIPITTMPKIKSSLYQEKQNKAQEWPRHQSSSPQLTAALTSDHVCIATVLTQTIPYSPKNSWKVNVEKEGKRKKEKKRATQPSIHLCTDNPVYFIAIIVINATQVKIFSKTLFK